jgi:alpha-L-fucosidase
MARILMLSSVAVTTLAILGISCASNDTSGTPDGSYHPTGGASGGTPTTATGGTVGLGGTTDGTGGVKSFGGRDSNGLGGSTNSNSNGGSSAVGGGSGGVVNGGSSNAGSGSGGVVNGGSSNAGSGNGGVVSGGSSSVRSGNGGARTGGAPGLGGSGDVSSKGGSGTGGSSFGGSATGGSSGGVAGSLSCPSLGGGPSPLQPFPSPAQIAYQRTELTAFIHYSMATYDGSEQGNPSDPPSMFNPTKLDATSVGQWASSLKAAGFGQAMLVTKHSVGFTLWPSKYTDYSVKSSPWMSGQGDVVQLFTDAMHAHDMRVALYLGPWDQKYPSSKADYETYFKNQLTELFSYGPAYEVEFDGYNAPTSNVDWKSVFQFIKQSQPDLLIWAGPEIVKTGTTPDVQWIGNENGQGTRTTSSLDTKNCGGGKTWCPYECNVSSRRPSWFWHPNESPMALGDMQKIYFATVGFNCTLNFNVPPSQTGEFDPKDLSLLQQFGTWYSSLYKTNLVKGQSATADSTWATAGFEASKAVDDDLCTYWAAASGKTAARLEVTPSAPVAAKLISIREAIELGERVTKYHVEIKQNGTWNTAPSDSSGAKIQGTVVGQRQLWQLTPATVEAVALVIESARDLPAIAELGVY